MEAGQPPALERGGTWDANVVEQPMPVSFRILSAKIACAPELQEKSATLKVEIKILVLPADNGTRGQRTKPRPDSKPSLITVHESQKDPLLIRQPTWTQKPHRIESPRGTLGSSSAGEIGEGGARRLAK